ncbi:hypothetical protein [Streptomyces scabiei]|uniref:hypothetical protein n=1 Tax=Streptomyces scabiei TaxID=1930 RepID=UPI000A717D87|nr:hypothetical protein [Streptomyces scabiei]
MDAREITWADTGTTADLWSCGLRVRASSRPVPRSSAPCDRILDRPPDWPPSRRGSGTLFRVYVSMAEAAAPQSAQVACWRG